MVANVNWNSVIRKTLQYNSLEFIYQILQHPYFEIFKFKAVMNFYQPNSHILFHVQYVDKAYAIPSEENNCKTWQGTVFSYFKKSIKLLRNINRTNEKHLIFKFLGYDT